MAAWLFAREAGLDRYVEPAVKRDLAQGVGSVRPYIWGVPANTLEGESLDAFYSDSNAWEDMAYLDYFLQPADRKPENMIWTVNNERKLIDHTLTFWEERFIRPEWIAGPRADVAYNRENGVVLKQQRLPERLVEKTEELWQRRHEIEQTLSGVLTEKEVKDTIRRIEKIHAAGIFM